MATKIRLQRHGKKGKPYFHIVADSRAKRDGRYIERIGNYNPNTNPATIELDFERAVHWLQVGAQPTDTAKAILSYKGAIYKNHLLKGIAKGALTEDQVNKKFDAWLSEKEGKVQAQVDSIKSADEKVKADVFAAEKAINEERANLIAAAQVGPLLTLLLLLKPLLLLSLQKKLPLLKLLLLLLLKKLLLPLRKL